MKRVICIILALIFSFSISACTLFNDSVGTQAEGTAGDNTATPGGSAAAGTGGSDAADAQNTGSVAQTGSNAADSTSAEGKVIKIALYFPTEDNSALKKEEREVQVVDGAILKSCVLALMEGPKTEGLGKAIPEGTKLLGISMKDKVATVDFSKEFLQTNGIGEVTSRFSVINTLTEIEGVEKVRLHIDGEEMIGASGLPLGAMAPAQLDKDGKPSTEGIKTITLYFSDSEAMYVVAERRQILPAKDESIEKAVLIELMKGPETNGLRGAIPNGTKLLSIGTQNGLCTVDLSSEFVDNSPGGTASERMTLSSVVNTLTELDGIDKVQFLIDGQKREVYTHAVFNEPFERDETIIKK